MRHLFNDRQLINIGWWVAGTSLSYLINPETLKLLTSILAFRFQQMFRKNHGLKSNMKIK